MDSVQDFQSRKINKNEKGQDICKMKSYIDRFKKQIIGIRMLFFRMVLRNLSSKNNCIQFMFENTKTSNRKVRKIEDLFLISETW